MRPTTLLLAVGTLLGGCGIFGPEDLDRVIATGTVYVDDEPAVGLQVSLSHLVPGCPFFAIWSPRPSAVPSLRLAALIASRRQILGGVVFHLVSS